MSNLTASTQYLLSIFPTPLIADSRKQSMGQWSSQLRCQRSLTGAVRHVCSARSASRSILALPPRFPGTPSPGQARGLFNMSFPRAQVLPVPITPLSSGLSPSAGHRSSSYNIGSTPAQDVGLIGRPLAPKVRPSTSGTPTPPSATSTSTGSLSTASPMRHLPSPKGVLGSSALAADGDEIVSDRRRHTTHPYFLWSSAPHLPPTPHLTANHQANGQHLPF